MGFIYSDEDQALIDASEQKCKQYEQALLNQFKSQGLDVERIHKQFLADITRKKMWEVHAESIQTRIPVGFSL